MAKQECIQLNSRQQQILLLLLRSSASMTLKVISKELRISIRTIQRELAALDDILHKYGLTLNKKTGVGLSVAGDEPAKQKLIQHLSINKSIKIFSPEERQYVMMQMLLSLREPTKLYFFSHQFDVTEATISNDLSKLEPWFMKHHIQLIRKPGLGVYIEGDEKSIREAIIDLIYRHFSQEQLMEVLTSYAYSFSDKMKLEISIRNHLLHFIDPQTIAQIEQVVQQTEKRWGYEMSDSAYIGLVVHIALAVQRLKHGENITIDTMLIKLKDTNEYRWAYQISEKLSSVLGVMIPESEIGYIAMHLLGAKAKRIDSASALRNDIEHYVYKMVQIVGRELKLNLENDASLMEHLTTHLLSAVNRISLQMDIRNPLLGHIKEKYPDVFAAARKASDYLEERLGCPIPEEEIGYLVMHFGAAVVRRKEINNNRYRVVLVCTSGLGTSRLLATQIEKELPHVQIVDTVSLLTLEEWLKNKPPVDLIISTVPFHHESYKVAVVNPFLQARDVELIESGLNSLVKEHRKITEDTGEIKDTVMKMNRYGEAMVHLLDHIYFLPDVEMTSKEKLITYIAEYVKTRFAETEAVLLENDLRKREEIGALVLEDNRLAMLHCRSEAVSKMCVCLVRLTGDIDWAGRDDSMGMPVNTILVLLAPRNAPKEYIELIGEISAALIEDEFIEALKNSNFSAVKNTIKTILAQGYLEKTNSVLRGNL